MIERVIKGKLIEKLLLFLKDLRKTAQTLRERDHRGKFGVFFGVKASDPLIHQQILTNWQKDTAAAVAILTARNVPQDAIAAFTRAADPAALTPADDTPWAEVKGLCDTHSDWQKTYYEFNATILELKLPGVFE